MGVEAFAVVHEEMGNRIVQVIVLETLLMTLMTFMMLWQHPANIPKKWIWAAFACELVAWVSSAVIQIPIQSALTHKDEAALNTLLSTDRIRTVAFVVYIIIVSRMLLAVLGTNNRIYQTTATA